MSGFSLSSEPFTLERDCSAVMVPQGESVVAVDYEPESVMLGAILSVLTFAFTLAAAAHWVRR